MSRRRVYGGTLITLLVQIPVVVVAALGVTFAFYEGRKAYWDNEVREMCARDGGVQIFQRVRISDADIRLLGRNNGNIAIPIKDLAPVDTPVYSEATTTYLHKINPLVWRRQVTVVGRVDGRVLAQWVVYSRVGGDFPGFPHPSYFGCPKLNKIASDTQDIFIVEGDER